MRVSKSMAHARWMGTSLTPWVLGEEQSTSVCARPFFALQLRGVMRALLTPGEIDMRQGQVEAEDVSRGGSTRACVLLALVA